MTIAPRVLLTRPQSESEALAPQVAALGLTPVIAPLMTIVPIPAQLSDGDVGGLLVTSPQATLALTRADRERFTGKPLYAVGATSAAAARQGGFRDVRIADGDAVALRDLVRLTHSRPTRLLYLAGRVRKAALTDALESDGHTVLVAETYDSQPLAWTAAVADSLRTEPLAAVLHFSRRSVELAVQEAGRWGLADTLGSALHVCLSHDVAQAVSQTGHTVVLISPQPTVASVLQVLVANVTTRD